MNEKTEHETEEKNEDDEDEHKKSVINMKIYDFMTKTDGWLWWHLSKIEVFPSWWCKTENCRWHALRMVKNKTETKKNYENLAIDGFYRNGKKRKEW